MPSKLREYIAYEIERSEAIIARLKNDPSYVEINELGDSRAVRCEKIIAFEQGRMAGLERLRIQCQYELEELDLRLAYERDSSALRG